MGVRKAVITNHKTFDNFNLKANFIYANTQRKTLPENSIGSLLYNAINMPPTLTPYDDNGDFTRATDLGNEVVNPLKQKDLSLNLTTADRFSSVFGLKYDILPELNVEANYQANYTEVFGQYLQENRKRKNQKKKTKLHIRKMVKQFIENLPKILFL